MGSWYQTCFVSHLPITEGERCRLFFIEPTDGWKGERVSAGFNHTHDVWAPCSFGLIGHWDVEEGHTAGIDETSLEARLLLNHVRRRLIQPEEGDSDPLNPTLLQEHIRAGRARFKDFKGREQPYGFVIVRDDVYMAILRKGFTCSWRTPKRFKVARLVQQGEDLVAALRKLRTAKQLRSELWEKMLFASDIEFVEYEGKDIEYDIPHFMTVSKGSFRDDLGHNLIDMVVKDSPDLPRFLRLMAEHYMFVSYLDVLRRAWMPQPGAGSQGMDYADHAWFAKLVRDIALRRDKA